MRVVFVAPFARYPKGTTRARVFPLARAMAARRHQVTVLVPPYDHPEESGERYVIGGAKVETLSVSAVPEQSARQALVQPMLALELTRRALALRPDVVHIFKPKAVSGLTQVLFWYGRRLARIGGSRTGGSRRRPAVVLDTDDWEGHGGWNEYEAYPWWQKEICDWQERWGLEHADALTVASRTLETQAWSHRVPPERVWYVPNGLDADDYRAWSGASGEAGRRRLGLAQEPLLLLYTRFFEFGPERAVAVLERVVRARPDVKLLVVGAGKYAQEQQLINLALDRGLAPHVVVAGWQPPEALAELIVAGDVALHPSDDNLANRAKCSAKLLEVLWLRRPVVADRVGQQAEYVQHEITGLLSNPSDPNSMAQAALRLLDDQALAHRLADAARRRVEQEFGWEHLAGGIEKAYNAALDRSATTR
ncbi:MAG TPA: glycosyltransferase family 4 protein [Chloroflexota bacterium]|nr:glycosyltransferase family 4 protein [Chloroflexota bacterium]